MNAPAKPEGVIEIHGKLYKTVAFRVRTFRDSEKYKGWQLVTEVVDRNENSVLVKASVIDDRGVVRSTGHGEESRAASRINKTSAMENAETSAVGRALGLLDQELMGSEVASADEVEAARNTQGFLQMMECIRDNWETLGTVKQAIADGELGIAKEAWNELSNQEKQTLWVAPSKGGVLTTGERTTMKSDDWSAA